MEKENVVQTGTGKDCQGLSSDQVQVKVKVYNFRRPDKFSRDHIRTVAIMHETFARLLTTSLSGYLRIMVHIRVGSVDQLTFEEFIRSIPNPATVAVINMDPLKGSALLEIDPPIAFTMIDRMFGGKGKALKGNRDLTDIECSAMEGLTVKILGNLREAWSTVIDLRPRLGQIETNPMFAQIVPPTEMVILVSLDVQVGETNGMINLCIPYLTIEPIIAKLSAQYWYSSVRSGSAKQPLKAAAGLKMDTVLYYQGEKLSLEAIYKLEKGSCIKLPGYALQEVFLENGGVTVLKLHRESTPQTKDLYFTAGKTEKAPVRMIAELFPQKVENGESASSLKGMLSAIIKNFADEVKENIKNLHKEIQKVQKKQDELEDQLFFETAGNGTPLHDEADKTRQKPFSFITMQNMHIFFALFRHEHPQVLAMILSYLSPEIAGMLLMEFSPELQVELAERIACLDRVSVEVLDGADRVLMRKLDVVAAADLWKAGGIESVVNILNLAPRSLEKHIIDTLDNCNGELSEEIKKRMFVFEDVVLLDKRALKKVLSLLKKEDLAIALRKTDPKVVMKINELLTKEEQEEIKKIQETRAPFLLKNIEEAQQRIVAAIRELEEKGEIIVARPGETV